MDRLLVYTMLCASIALPTYATDAYQAWVESPRYMMRAQTEIYARLVFEESDAAGIQRPIIDISPEHGTADAVRFYPLVKAGTGQDAPGWGIKLNPGMIIDTAYFHEPRLRFMARYAVCYHERASASGTPDLSDAHDHRQIARCAYHKYSADDHEYIALYRADQNKFLAAAGLEIQSDEVARQLLRRMYGDRPLAHWTGR